MAEDVDATLANRQDHYGDPKNNFTLTHNLWKMWEAEREAALKRRGQVAGPLEMALRHGVYMMLLKIARMAESIGHPDSLHDTKGYARCNEQILGLKDADPEKTPGVEK